VAEQLPGYGEAMAARGSTRNIPSLTGVRGIAALWVLVYHLQSFSHQLGIGALGSVPLLRGGWAGVDLFFVLSGFVLMLTHEKQFRALSWEKLGRFAALRALRIYPVSTAVLLMILALVTIDAAFRTWFAQAAVPTNLTATAFVRTLFLANRWWLPADGDWNQPTWSLSAELLGYVAFPFIAVVATRIRNRPALIAMAIVCLLFPVMVSFRMSGRLYDDDIFWGALPRMIGSFCGGIVLCRLHRLTPDVWRTLQGRIADLALLLVVVDMAIPHASGAAPLLFGLLVYGLAAGRGAANAWFSTPFSVLLGRISFPLYLVHVMFILWLAYGLEYYHVPEWGRLLGVPLLLGFCFGSAWLLHIGIERPAHGFARALFERRQAAPPPLTRSEAQAQP